MKIGRTMILLVVCLLSALLGGCGRLNHSVIHCDEGTSASVYLEGQSRSVSDDSSSSVTSDAGSNVSSNSVTDDAGSDASPNSGSTDVAFSSSSADGHMDENLGIVNQSSDIYVHVCGCVKDPGLYHLSSQARIGDAVEAAGGFTKEANQSSVNLAGFLEDGTQIYVCSVEETTLGGTDQSGLHASDSVAHSSASTNQTVEDDKININTADATTLTNLNGIGVAKAQAIIDYRQEHGAYSSIEEITQVDGIGDGTYQKIKDHIVVK